MVKVDDLRGCCWDTCSGQTPSAISPAISTSFVKLEYSGHLGEGIDQGGVPQLQGETGQTESVCLGAEKAEEAPDQSVENDDGG